MLLSEAQREFDDLLASDPDFNYDEYEFSQWVLDHNIVIQNDIDYGPVKIKPVDRSPHPQPVKVRLAS